MVVRSGFVAACGVFLAACSSSSHGSSASNTTAPTTTVAPAPTSGAGSSTPSSTSSTSTTTSTSTTIPGRQSCATSALTASVGSPNGAAGSTYYVLTFTNTSSTACIINGYPGVSYVAGSDGTQIGAPAARLPGTVTAITVQSGASAFATLREVVAGNYGSSCGLTNVAGLRIYPPNQTAALFVAQKTQGCSNSSDLVLQVGPFASTAAGASS